MADSGEPCLAVGPCLAVAVESDTEQTDTERAVTKMESYSVGSIVEYPYEGFVGTFAAGAMKPSSKEA